FVRKRDFTIPRFQIGDQIFYRACSKYSGIDLRTYVGRQLDTQIAGRKLNICSTASPSVYPESDIDRSAADRRRRTSTDYFELCRCFKKIDPHRAFNAGDRKVTFAAVDLEVAIARNRNNVIYPKRKAQKVFWEFLPKSFIA